MCEPITALFGLGAASSAAGVGAAGAAAGSAAAGASAAGAMSTASMVASVGSAMLTAYGAYQQSKSLKNQAKYEGQMADIERAQADRAATRDAEHTGTQLADVRGRQKAALGASGVDLNSGSAAALQQQTDYYGMSDMMAGNENALNQDYAYRGRGKNARETAASINPWVSAGGSLLTNAGKVSEKWYAYKKSA
jgi:hypothetical protein